jgi:hypothetical protein
MGDLVIIDKRKRAPAQPEPEMITERFAVTREAFEDFARHGRADRRPRPIPEPTQAQRRAAIRTWTDQAAGTLWWEAQKAGQRGDTHLMERILAKREELLIAAQEQLGEVWV